VKCYRLDGAKLRAVPLRRVRELADRGGGLDRDVLVKGASLGWFHGSAEALAAVAEERGRLLQPGPFVPSAVVVSALASAQRRRRAGARPSARAEL
jgi:hypothetical protein